MPEYQARIIHGQGNADEVILIDCSDDAAAVEAVELLVDKLDIQLWRSAVKLGTLHPHDEPRVEKLSENVVSFQRKQ